MNTKQMYWEKKGQIFTPSPDSWMHAYAQVPTPLVFDDFIRIYFGCRPKIKDIQPISQIGFVDVDRNNPTRILRHAEKPVLPLGDIGCFDEFGLHPISVLRVENEIWLYYVGWTRMQSVPFNRAIGLAISKDDGLTYQRYSRGPIVGASHHEPYLQQGPHVKVIDGTWHMWYLTGTDWIPDADGRMEAIYRIVHATSTDGIHWQRDGKHVLETVEENECHAGQAVIHRRGSWQMWFSYRRGLQFRNAEGGYRIGYASSNDLAHWQRDDAKAGIAVSSSGWDAEMVCYPSIVELDGKTLLFYCGNYFGKDGFGYAELIEA
ncbi:MAG: hypothetical protein KGZ83_07080 [Sulfuricella sp.]|nr:hypothetical protein [Sulfuricella sp.]